jgi:hypothetical protein
MTFKVHLYFALLILVMPVVFVFSYANGAEKFLSSPTGAGIHVAGKNELRGKPLAQTPRAATAPTEQANTSPAISVSRDNRISADINNRPLNEVLHMMMEKRFFEIRGPLPSSDPVTINFADLTLDEAMKKLLRGYNYVLIGQGANQVPLLMVMGRTQRSNLTYELSAPPVSPSPISHIAPASTGQPPSATGPGQTGSYEAQPFSAPTFPAGAVTAAPQQDTTMQGTAAAAGGGSSPQKSESGSTGTLQAASQQTTSQVQATSGTFVPPPGGDPNYRPGGPGFVPAPVQGTGLSR